MAKERKVFTAEEVAAHNKDNDCWIVVDGLVFDVSKFAHMHPGGKGVLMGHAGKDATEVFYQFHRYDIFTKYADRLVIGELAGGKPVVRAAAGQLSKVPFGEVSSEQGFLSPFYNESHHTFRANLRKLVDTDLMPNAPMWEEAGKEPSPALFKKLGQAGVWATRLAPGKHLSMFDTILGVPADKLDIFHELICHQEIARLGCPGLVDGLGSGLVIGLPPVIHFGSREVQERIVRPCVMGDKKICLAISEAVAGSDVANIATTAVKSPCGQFYIVNGTKKWITNGTSSDYFVTAVRTGGKGIGGISLLLIERSEGLETSPIKTSYSPAAGTAYITLENVKVPVSNLLGSENEGFKCIMANFNHERWMICAATIRVARCATEESLKWANQRRVFGQPLIAQPVIRAKLAKMIANVEACESWLENITYQMKHMSYQKQSKHLAGPIALLKYQTTRALHSVVDDAQQIFGGRGITRTGMGQVVERISRSHKFSAILGGSEEIMADLGVRQSLRFFPEDARL